MAPMKAMRVRRKRKRVKGASSQAHASDLLCSVALDAQLSEGPEGVRQFLRCVYRASRPIPIGDLARSCQLPLPVAAAVRGELEKRNLIERRGGIAFTEKGKALAFDLGFSSIRRFTRPAYPELGEEFRVLIRRMELFCQDRPRVAVELDQSHATAETVLRRAVYMFEQDAIEGRNLIILGDDDLTSLAIRLVAEHLEIESPGLVVLECDTRLVDYLTEACEGDSGCTVLKHDLRENLPHDLLGRFDVFLTDPPYTIEGLKLFVSRGVEALQPVVRKQGFLCFGNRTPSDMSLVVRILSEMGLAPIEILPNFNTYVGAQVLAGVSQMIHTVSTSELLPGISGHYTGPLYTADRKRHVSDSAP